MSNQEILTKAIEKAIAGGWKSPVNPLIEVIWTQPLKAITFVKSYEPETPDHRPMQYSIVNLNVLIFNHDFAKALWGDKLIPTAGDFVEAPAWYHHLQQMVIADDPIKYLGAHLDD